MLMGSNEMMDGLELAGLPAPLPTVGCEEGVSTSVMCCTAGSRAASRHCVTRGTRAELLWCPRKVSAEPVLAASLTAEYCLRQEQKAVMSLRRPAVPLFKSKGSSLSINVLMLGSSLMSALAQG